MKTIFMIKKKRTAVKLSEEQTANYWMRKYILLLETYSEHITRICSKNYEDNNAYEAEVNKELATGIRE